MVDIEEKVEDTYAFYDQQHKELDALEDEFWTIYYENAEDSPDEAVCRPVSGHAENVFKIILDKGKNIAGAKLSSVLREREKAGNEKHLEPSGLRETIRSALDETLNTQFERIVIFAGCRAEEKAKELGINDDRLVDILKKAVRISCLLLLSANRDNNDESLRGRTIF